MKETLEKLAKEAGERLKDLQRIYDKLNDEFRHTENVRAAAAAEATKGFSSDIRAHMIAVEKSKTITEQLVRVRGDIAGQQQYVASVSNQYVELVRMETSAKSQYGSTGQTMFAQSGGSQQTGSANQSQYGACYNR